MAQQIFRYLDTNGDGTGTKNATGNYSDAGLGATDFYFQPALPCYIHRMILFIEDTAGFTAEEYGNTGGALTNGWEVKVKDSSDVVQLDLTDGVAIKTNAEIARNCYDADVKAWGTTPADEALVGRWTFDKSGAPLYLGANDKLVITLNDDCSGLIEHYFQIQGVYD